MVTATGPVGAATAGYATAGGLLGIFKDKYAPSKALNAYIHDVLSTKISETHLGEDDRKHIRQMVEHIDLSTQTVITSALDANDICDVLLENIVANYHATAGTQDKFRKVMVHTIQAVLDSQEVATKLRPRYEQTVAKSLRAIGDTTERTDQAVGRLEQRQDAATIAINENNRLLRELLEAQKSADQSTDLLGVPNTNLLSPEDIDLQKAIQTAMKDRDFDTAKTLLDQALPKLTTIASDKQAQLDQTHDRLARMIATDADRLWQTLESGLALDRHGDAILAARDPALVTELTNLRARQINFSVHRQRSFKAAQSIAMLERIPSFEPDVYTFTTLIAKAETHEQAQEMFKSMNAAEKVEPNAITFSTLIAKAETYAQATEMFDAMNAAEGVVSDEFTMTSMITKSDTYEQGQQHYGTLLDLGGSPDDYVIGALMRVCETSDDANFVIAQAKEYDVKPDRYVLSQAISLQESFTAASALFTQYRRNGVEPDDYDVTSVISKADEFGPAFQIAKTFLKSGNKAPPSLWHPNQQSGQS